MDFNASATKPASGIGDDVQPVRPPAHTKGSAQVGLGPRGPSSTRLLTSTLFRMMPVPLRFLIEREHNEKAFSLDVHLYAGPRARLPHGVGRTAAPRTPAPGARPLT